MTVPLSERRSDGGPAFPQSLENTRASSSGALPSGGMSLRDYFAAAVMSDVLRSFNWTNDQIEQSAIMCYRLADAMLAERNEP